MNPKAFISHASEDKGFVIPFATKLRENGIEAWVDQWEINPGDSLVDKIFNEGLKDADVFLIVLSRTSVEKPWVKEELNNGMVQKIQRSCRIIPVVIDDCNVPECLRTTVWQRIHDTSDYGKDFDVIVNAIFGHYDKPAVGAPPARVQTKVDLLPHLDRSDSIVLTKICAMALENDGGFHQDLAEDRSKEAEFFGLSETDVYDSLEILKRRGYIELTEFLGGHVGSLEITPMGFDLYARNCIGDYDEKVNQVALYLTNRSVGGQANSGTVATDLHMPLTIVMHIFNLFESRGLLEQIHGIGGPPHAWNISPELKRILRQNR